MKELDPEFFTYELYEPNYWERFGLAYDDFDNIKLSQEVVKCAEGYCDASRLLVRPKTGQIARMCVDSDGDKFWFHTYKNYITTESEVR